MIRVFLLDDHEIVRRGTAELLGCEDDVQVVGEAATVDEALRRIPAVRPDVAILDARLPDGSGIDVCREIRADNPEIRCLILTSYDDDEAVFAAVLAGASGYVLKQIRGSNLVDAVRQVAAGRSLLDPGVTERVLSRIRGGGSTDPRLALLNDQERRILDLITDGMTNRQIGDTLFLAEQTVKNNVSSLLSKLGMQRRTQVAALGAQLRGRSGESGLHSDQPHHDYTPHESHPRDHRDHRDGQDHRPGGRGLPVMEGGPRNPHDRA